MTPLSVAATALGLMVWAVAPGAPWGPYLTFAGAVALGADAVTRYLDRHYPQETP